MTYDLTLENIISSLRKRRASSCFDLLAYCGFTLRYVGSGQYRNVYQIVGTPYLVKVPITHGRRKTQSLLHARAEYEAYQRIMRSNSKYVKLQPYMPDVLRYIPSTGVIVTRRMRALGRGSLKEQEKVGKIAGSVMGKYCDLHGLNFKRDDEGNLKIIDLGYFVSHSSVKDKL